MSPQLLITVDTELSNFPDGQGLWGRVGSGNWGLERMIAAFNTNALRATFFLDVYGKTDAELAHQKNAAKLIAESGHDLQLHTHPAPAFDRKRHQLRDYTLAEQREIIRQGADRIYDWTGTRPVLHRAGDWAADHHSLQALRDYGFRADFSASSWSKNCGIDPQAINGNGWTKIDGMLCGVGTCYRDRLTGRLRRLDIGGVSFRELRDILAHRVNPLFLTLHSFSFLKFNHMRTKFRAFPDYVEELARFSYMAQGQWGYRSITALEAVTEIENLMPSQLPWAPFPTSGVTASAAGIVKSIRGRVVAFSR